MRVASLRAETLCLVRDPWPPERPVLRREEHRVGPLFFGPGQTDLLCGACTFLLVRGANGARSIQDAIIVCPNCGAGNEGCLDVPTPR